MKIVLVLSIITTVLLLIGLRGYENERETVEKNTREVYIGAWVGGSWDSKTKTLDTKVIKDFENLIDKKLAIVNMFSEWTYLENPDLLKNLGKISENGWVPMISANPFFFEKCPEDGKDLYEKIASGECDEFMRAASKNLANYKKPVLLRFAWEMNLPDMWWSVEKVGSSPTDFIGAWRRFYDISKEEKAENIVWVLSFNTSHSETTPYVELYPGDGYVDWVAIDGYNWGDSHEWAGWANFDGVFRNSYEELIAVTTKPVMLSEVNSAPTGGNKAEWLTNMLEEEIVNSYLQVRAVVFFNENKSEGESVDWRLEKSNDYAAAVREGLRLPIYVSSFP